MRKALYILGELHDTDIEWMAENGAKRHISEGTVLIREGEPVVALFILLDGRLVVSAGDGTEIASLFPGEMVGEISFVDSRPPMASVIAAQDSRTLAIPRNILNARLERRPEFAARFYRALAVFLADRLRTTTGRLGYGNAPADDVDELADDQMEKLGLAATRFDKMLKRLLQP